MNRALLHFIRHFENRLLLILLVRFATRQIVANTRNSSELVDCATVIIYEVKV
jgi:hypothetical protein